MFMHLILGASTKLKLMISKEHVDHSRAIEIDPYHAFSFNSRAIIKGQLGDIEVQFQI